MSPFIYHATRKTLKSPMFTDPDSDLNQRVKDKPQVYELIDQLFPSQSVHV